LLKDGGVTGVLTAVAAAMMNAHAERFGRAVKYEGLNKLILTNETQLRYALGEYLEDYHHERFDTAWGRIIEPKPEYQTQDGWIFCVERLGGLPQSYPHKVA
jgi:DNA phosphorothioation-dependent restriction protein DptG